ncbi:hypothetical protein F6B93_19305 [Mycobacterium spongiae]|uniref:Uncharacterized protein n=2 Tax=Mycobacterium spongiae TaxID=886343 RepID=A0A975K247_9MYCO|nr:hypothetical protein [Mycobacterium spongiae]QUR69954.1 hypothetical protein F6B93_19305 [Mycobacterium spongiae]
MWLTFLKALLIAWLVIALAAILVGAIRRSRRFRSYPNWSERGREQPGFEASIRGAMPVTPLPEWVDWDDDDTALDDKEREQQVPPTADE